MAIPGYNVEGERGAGTRENWGREAGEKMAGSGIARETKRNLKRFQKSKSAGQRSRGQNGGKVRYGRRERKVREPGKKGTGSGKFIPPCPPTIILC